MGKSNIGESSKLFLHRIVKLVQQHHIFYQSLKIKTENIKKSCNIHNIDLF